MNLKINNKGFTLVELLIVIVIIAILAAISIVAYNGITERAHNSTAKDAAGQVKTKAELFKQVQGEYPANIAGFTDPEVVEAELGELASKDAGASTSIDSGENLFRYTRCTDPTSAEIEYYDTKGSGTDSVGTGANSTSTLALNGGC